MLFAQQEKQRLDALYRYGILDTPPDGAFDKITAMVAKLLKVPVAIVSLVDTHRIWFKSHHGIGLSEVERVPGLCSTAILSDVPYVVNDASIDPRSLTNPWVTGELGVQFYAGIPLKTQDGYNLGALCAIDFQPRTITNEGLNILQTLASVVMDEMELRLAASRIDDLRIEKELIIQSAGEGICTVDNNKRVTSWNPAAEKITGYTREVVMYQDIHEIMHLPCTQIHQNKECNLCKAIDKEMAVEINELSMPRQNGSVVQIELVNTPVLNENRVVGAVMLFKDISQRKRTEELNRKIDRLEIASRLAAGIGHELRNPLTAIKGFIQLLKNPQHETYFRVLEDEVSRIESLADEFVLLTDVHAMQVTKIGIQPLLENIKQLLVHQYAECKVDMQVICDHALPDICCDETRLKRALFNVAENAIEASSDGGTVTIRCAHLSRDKILVQITDHGIGIAPERLSHLGEPRYITNESGTGLGLMVSQHIIQKLNGELSIESRVGHGTTVDITLPIYCADYTEQESSTL